jgi:ribosome maturation factor RimP
MQGYWSTQSKESAYPTPFLLQYAKGIKDRGVIMHLPKERIIELVKDTVETLGYSAVEIRLVTAKNRKELKLVIYNPEKDISMDDCSSVANVVLRRVELDDPEFSEVYDLVVESPGVDRKITSAEEVLLFRNREIRFAVKTPANYGLKDNVVIGLVQEGRDGVLKVDAKGKIYEIPWSDVSSAKLYFDIKKYL